MVISEVTCEELANQFNLRLVIRRTTSGTYPDKCEAESGRCYVA